MLHNSSTIEVVEGQISGLPITIYQSIVGIDPFRSDTGQETYKNLSDGARRSRKSNSPKGQAIITQSVFSTKLTISPAKFQTSSMDGCPPWPLKFFGAAQLLHQSHNK